VDGRTDIAKVVPTSSSVVAIFSMPFRFWLYLAKVGGFILVAMMLPAFFVPKNSILGAVGSVATCILILLGVTGAVMGGFLAFGKLKMLCPFCGKSGRVGASQSGGLGLVCETCGIVRTSGFLGLQFVKEPIADEEEDEEQPDRGVP
jgi:hypothetical protein